MVGDAGAAALERGSFDLLFSRFGVMFFEEPSRVFTHLGAALKPEGRLAFVCWRPLAENEWARIPYEAAVKVVGPQPPPVPNAPGPFAFGDPARVRGILEAAGFKDVAFAKLDRPQRMGLTARPTPDDAADFATKLGPSARVLYERDPETIAKARAAIREAVAPYEGPEGVRMKGACWIVTARNRS